jgi:hypothetical protein
VEEIVKHHLAFKVTWVYGTKGPFTSPCNAEGRIVNIRREKKVWCTQKENPCLRILVDDDNKGAPDEIPCYDAAIFKLWAFGGGVYHTGERVGEPICIRHVEPGSYAFFTSKPYGAPEDARVVIGCFEVAEPEREADPHWGFRVTSVPSSRIRLRDLDNAPRFWQSHHQNGPPRWGTGLFRYLPNYEAFELLAAVREAAAREKRRGVTIP